MLDRTCGERPRASSIVHPRVRPTACARIYHWNEQAAISKEPLSLCRARCSVAPKVNAWSRRRRLGWRSMSRVVINTPTQPSLSGVAFLFGVTPVVGMRGQSSSLARFAQKKGPSREEPGPRPGPSERRSASRTRSYNRRLSRRPEGRTMAGEAIVAECCAGDAHPRHLFALCSATIAARTSKRGGIFG